jgi:murein DD-endopeptidase MepM/ murein hydrolase activator NlpD
MKRALLTLTILSGFLFLGLASTLFSTRSLAGLISSPTPGVSPKTMERELQNVELAIEQAIEEESEFVLGLLVNKAEVTNLELSLDTHWAVGWLVLSDPDTGETLPTEPGLVLAKRSNSGWDVALPSDENWLDQIGEVPAELLSDEQKAAWTDMYLEYAESLAAGPFGGYLLPWEEGKAAWLSQSVAHDKYNPSGSAHYAFDFYIPQTMFNVYAAKGGRVWYAKWNVPNGDKSGTGNYLVIEDTTTTPATYQLYLHLAYESIPPALRTRGAYVIQGQFIGVADDTGQSTGHHLHFHVHTNPFSYWGTSLDITFDDVPINGGRPRVDGPYFSDRPYCRVDDVCNEFQAKYVSGNAIRSDPHPPQGGLTAPLTGITLNSDKVRIEGWARDADSGLDEVQVLAKFAGSWKTVASKITSDTFGLDWDMCSANVPDGPVSLALKIKDKSGNQAEGIPGLTHIIKDYSCPPVTPPCLPGDTQIALFAKPNYSGACTVLPEGNYSTSAAFGPLAESKAASVLVGSQVLTTFYTGDYFTGRSETVVKNDSNLADNLIGANQVSSLRVRLQSVKPNTPWTLTAPQNGDSFLEGSSITLAWRIPTGGIEFQVELNGPGGTRNSSWSSQPYWNLVPLNLAMGSYTWQVKARNGGGESAWSPTGSFTINANTLSPAAPVAAPLFFDMEDGAPGWSASGLWKLSQDPNRSFSPTSRWHYGSYNAGVLGSYSIGKSHSGSLTSPPISLPDPGTPYLLRFWYRYQTEGPGVHWDRRLVQISRNNGPFLDVLQLTDDPGDVWLNASLDLTSYAGSTIRVRFHFETLDADYNEFEGWFIDDFEIRAASLPDCGEPPSATGVIPISYGETKAGRICPSGDIDFFSFSGAAGDRILAIIDPPPAPPSNFALELALLDGDKSSILATYSVDASLPQEKTHVNFLLTRPGTYYLKVYLRTHPSAGGPEYSYSLQLLKDDLPPTAAFTYPPNGAYLPHAPIDLTVQASDGPPVGGGSVSSGIRKVEFFWHSGDWWNDDWQLLGVGAPTSEGWKYSFDIANIPKQNNMAFYTNVSDWAGNWTGAGAWDAHKNQSEIFMPVVLR